MADDLKREPINLSPNRGKLLVSPVNHSARLYFLITDTEFAVYSTAVSRPGSNQTPLALVACVHGDKIITQEASCYTLVSTANVIAEISTLTVSRTNTNNKKKTLNYFLQIEDNVKSFTRFWCDMEYLSHTNETLTTRRFDNGLEANIGKRLSSMLVYDVHIITIKERSHTLRQHMWTFILPFISRTREHGMEDEHVVNMTLKNDNQQIPVVIYGQPFGFASTCDSATVGPNTRDPNLPSSGVSISSLSAATIYSEQTQDVGQLSVTYWTSTGLIFHRATCTENQLGHWWTAATLVTRYIVVCLEFPQCEI
ncbi:hypothetical protein CBL_05562 [Carabus blaptoides fortunei]